MSFTIAFVAEGDANTADCWSGSGRSFVEALRATGNRVDVYNAELASWPRAIAAGLTYHPTRERWRQRYLLGTLPFRARSSRIRRALIEAAVSYDAVVQIGATFSVPKEARQGAQYIIYCDSNVAYARSGAPFSAASKLQPHELELVMQRERNVYDGAARIWTMSEALAASFVSDFAQPRAKLKTIYAGANNRPSPTGGDRSRQRILFVGKDHARKGSALLLAAFAKVRAEIPTAELHLVGGIPPDAEQPGVVVHGFVSRANPDGARLLDKLYSSASIFCMPSRYEPFGIAFIEAMLAGLPCVGTAAWAMPEIIEDGRTGWLIPDGSVDALTSVLMEAVRNPDECARRGALGRERSEALFTWDRVAARAISDLNALREAALPTQTSVMN